MMKRPNFWINNWLYLGALSLVLIIHACDTDDEQSLPDRDWRLVWSDEFDGEAGASPDSTKWTYDIGNGTDGWGNQELQFYTDSPENISMDGDGNLQIIARRQSAGGFAFTSARIKTQGIFTQKYGRYEARMKMPWGPGLWPAFWLLGDDIDEVSWPQCGEIDVMEYRGQEPSIVHGSVHGPGYSGGNAVTRGYSLINDRFDNDFHVFAIEWEEDVIDFFVDDVWYQRITPDDVDGEWVYDHPFFIILNVAVGGNYVGFPTDDTSFPQVTLVDYVRVYE